MAQTNYILDLLEKEALAQGLNPEYAKRIAKIESNYNQSAISPKGAIGVMQLMPATAKSLGVNPNILEENIRGGVKYLKQMSDMFGGNANLMAAAYNAGPGNVKKYGGVPPFPETDKYVSRFNGKQPTGENMTAPSGNNNILDIIMQLQQKNQQASMDPTQFIQPEKKLGALDILSGALGGLGALGGTVGNIISAVKGRPMTGTGAVESGLGILQGLSQKQAQNQKTKQINALLQNENVPKDIRNSLALTSSGVPPALVNNLNPDQSDLIKQALQLQQLQKNSPEGLSESAVRSEEKAYNTTLAREEAKQKAKDSRVLDLQQKIQKSLQDGDTGNALVFKGMLKNETGYSSAMQSPQMLKIITDQGEKLSGLKNIYTEAQKIHGVLNSMKTGPFSGRLGMISQEIMGEGPYQTYKSLVSLLQGPVARELASEKGVLTDRDITNVREALEKPSLTIKQRSVIYDDFMDKLEKAYDSKLKRMDILVGDSKDPQWAEMRKTFELPKKEDIKIPLLNIKKTGDSLLQQRIKELRQKRGE